jgi:multidrug efflux pump subunit AcrA (membrane-fusion protein)
MTPKDRHIARWATLLALTMGVVLYAAGVIDRDRVHPGRVPEPAGLPAPPRTATAERGVVPVVEEAVGTVRSLREVIVAAQVTARVTTVGAKVGDRVTAGSPLVVLENSDFVARFSHAKAQYDRVKGFLARQAATTEQMEAAEAEYSQAKVAMDHTRILAPVDGVVAERHVEPGDLAVPGRPLLIVLDPNALRLEAQVREGLIARIVPGGTLDVAVPAADTTLRGTVAEILPSADARSRTFEVRINLTAVPGVYPGMFGRLRLPVGEREVVRVPAAAVERIGQLETVLLQGDGSWSRRLITTGGTFPDGTVEVLSGLAGGETIGLPPA